MKKFKIVIFGAGTAGTIVSTYLKSFFDKNIDVEVYYNFNNRGINVGESTTTNILSYLKQVKITPKDLVQNTNSTIKLGIKFKNWTKQNHHYYHNFLDDLLNFDDPFCLMSAYGIANNKHDGGRTYSDYFCDKNKIPNRLQFLHGMHINTLDFGKYIESQYSNKINFQHGIIKDVVVTDDKIDFVILEDERKIYADLFIDATGFSQVLFKKLNSNWIDKTDYVPIDSAIPFHIQKTYNHIEPYTLAEATDNGWIWQIPLSNRYGSGCLYSSQFISDDEAAQKYQRWLRKNHNVNLDYDRIIRFKSGFWKEQWIGNCIAVGLSSGFVEPLESTNIHTAIVQAENICNHLSLEKTSRFDIQKYNQKLYVLFDDIYNFIRLHYHTQRTDSNFWKYMKSSTPEWIKELEEKLETQFISSSDFIHDDTCFTEESYIQVMNGLGMFKNKNIIKKYLESKNLQYDAKVLYDKHTRTKAEQIKQALDHKMCINLVSK